MKSPLVSFFVFRGTFLVSSEMSQLNLPVCVLLFSSTTQVHGRHGKMRPRALKDLTVQFLGIKIQGGEHNPVRNVVLIGCR